MRGSNRGVPIRISPNSWSRSITSPSRTESRNLAIAPSPVLCSQRLLVQLPERRQRNVIDKLDRFRRVDDASLLLHIVNEFNFLGFCTGLQHNERFDELAPLGVRNTDYRRE